MLNALEANLAGVVGGAYAPSPLPLAFGPRPVSPPQPIALDAARHRASPATWPRIDRAIEPSPTAAFAAIAYPTLKGLALAPSLAFETQLMAQETPAAADSRAAIRAYASGPEGLVGILGLLDPLDLRV
jgi:hypothetical protein